MHNNQHSSYIDSLRAKALVLLNSKQYDSFPVITEDEKLLIIHELDVHQIELELQNEELLDARSIAQQSSDKYKELYDFAPTGYFTLSRKGEINELNLTGSNLLGKTRSELKDKRFSLFITDDTKPVFNLFFEKIFESKVKESCEVTLTAADNNPIYVFISGITIEDGK